MSTRKTSYLGGYESIRRACVWCGDELTLGTLGIHCSAKCERDSRNGAPCMYCGMMADSEDHVIPRAYRANVADIGGWRRFYPELPDVVACCRECNSLAGAKVFETVEDKRAYVHERLRSKYRRFLSMPQWSTEELDELGVSLRRYVDAGQQLGSVIRSRLRWPQGEDG